MGNVVLTIVNSGKQSPPAGHKLPRNLFEAAAFTLLEEISLHSASLRRGAFFVSPPAIRRLRKKASAPQSIDAPAR
jgi:hypothetical protein